MSEPKFTPGPWRYLPPDVPNGPAIVPETGPEIISFFNENSDYLFDPGRDQGEHEANARLIAAAPEMFAACEAMIKRVCEDVDGTMVLAVIPPNAPEIKAMRAAIARALSPQRESSDA